MQGQSNSLPLPNSFGPLARQPLGIQINDGFLNNPYYQALSPPSSASGPTSQQNLGPSLAPAAGPSSPSPPPSTLIPITQQVFGPTSGPAAGPSPGEKLVLIALTFPLQNCVAPSHCIDLTLSHDRGDISIKPAWVLHAFGNFWTARSTSTISQALPPARKHQ